MLHGQVQLEFTLGDDAIGAGHEAEMTDMGSMKHARRAELDRSRRRETKQSTFRCTQAGKVLSQATPPAAAQPK